MSNDGFCVQIAVGWEILKNTGFKMSYLLFMDESGHDHQQLPYEVRGGIAIHASYIWKFTTAMRNLELAMFGTALHEFGTEIKGRTLLDKDRFKWAAQLHPATGKPYIFTTESRRELAMDFLKRGKENKEGAKIGEPSQSPGRLRMTAYGQSCLLFVDNMMHMLLEQHARLFAVAIPRGANKPLAGYNSEFLRKDLIYLFEIYCYFLTEEQETGLMVMDQIEKINDRRLGQSVARYFSATVVGRQRAERVVPVPLFVTSDLTYAIQAADICIYALNWGFRLPLRGMNSETRPEIASRYGALLGNLQWRGRVERGGQEFSSYGIAYVSDPFASNSKIEGDNKQNRSY